MTELFQKVVYYFEFPFVRYALIVGVLIALCSSLLGVVLVLRRFSFISDGLSHMAFGVMAVAAVLRLTNEMLLVIPVTVISAVLLMRTGNKKIKGDAAIAMLSVGALAIGYLLMNVFSVSTNVAGDICSSLFGSTSVLTLSRFEVWLCLVLSVIVIAFFVLFYNKIFSVTFDEDFTKSCGIKTNLLNTGIAVFFAIIIVLAMNLVGSLLISALVVFPALSAMNVCKSFKPSVILSAIISVACAAIGIIFSLVFSTPVGATVATADIIVFLLTFMISKICKS